MTNIRKIPHSTFFTNLELYDEENRYHSLQTDEELVEFFHEMLTIFEKERYVIMYLYEMIEYGVNANLNLIPRSI